MSDSGDFWSELRRRKVVRTAIVYAAVAWGTVEVTSVVQPALHLPGSVLTFVVIAAIVGFPVVIAMEWLYEWSAGGIRRTTGDGIPDGGSSLVRPLIAGAVVVAITGVAAWRLLPASEPADDPAAPVVREAVAIVPFAYSGSSELDYLREGLVDLLSAKLEGVETVRPLNPRSVLTFVTRRDIDASDPDQARRVAEHFGAGSFIQGSYVEVGGGVQIRASMYRTDEPDRPVVEATAEGRADDLFRLVDQIAASILAGSALPSPSRLTPVAALTTDSLSAIKAFLRGEASYRAGRYEESISAYDAATEVDTTFALAFFRKAMAASWAERHDLGGAAFAAAYALRERLSLQDRRLVEAEAAYRGGRHVEAARLFADIVEQNPEDAEAWYQLGEVRMHDGHWSGTDPATAVEAFRRAVEIDPDHFGALLHLSHYAATMGRIAELDSVSARLIELNPDAAFVPQLRDLASGGPGAVDSAIERIGRGVAGVDPLFVSFATWFVPDAEVATRVGEAMTRPGFDAAWTPIGHLLAADGLWSQGRWREARERLDRAAALDPADALEHRAYLTLAAPEVLTTGDLDALREDLVDWNGSGSEGPGTNPTPTSPHAGLHPHLRLYLLGLVEARLGRADAARSRADTLQSATAAAPEPFGDLIADFATVVRAEAARADGDPERALAILERARLWSEYGPDGRTSPLMNQLYPVFLRAELLREAGREREALRWYRGLLLPLHEAPVTLGQWRSADILESLGERDAAERLMEAVRTRWADADPELRDALARGARGEG